ncbi:response regulator transcription factor [Mucilaginibacter myungsuensis]|uniref:DNA-binding response regulator n=1 Tax=Mucilaginibacter myungsuensis TaxID=649104 RepID=A0A929L4Q3_9SPHI|nr:LuxR C-terminal-related transcriptional regulator [Mucilaginibacter myungsuensis]MBE9663975.1 DNA-binding response regulator [Mucilaginibacter myungsuensis]MDN3601154.1 LuxR C-terminal-related transcriptional regulator [Mucilaginibacter myungsuensis]
MTTNTVFRNRSVLIYGLSLALLMFLLKWLEWRFLVIDHATEIYAGCIAVLFTGLGIWLALKLARPKVQTVIVEREVIIRTDSFMLDEKQLEATGISKRELEVLQLMAEGLSNEQIAERIFVSVNTVKTHSSKLFGKLDVIRRTHAIDKARKLNLIP